MNNKNTLLLVEDEAIIAMAIRQELSEAGYPNCIIQRDKGKILELFASQPIDMILMDVNLGKQSSGISILQQIRAAGFLTPVIFISGFIDPTTKQAADAFHPLACLEKPIQTAILIQILNNYFQTKIEPSER